MGFDKEGFLEFAVENGVVGFSDDPMTLKSGRESHFYVNWRDVAEDVYLLDKLTDFVLDFVEGRGLDPDCFYGVPEGATKLGLVCQYKMAKRSGNLARGSHTLPMGRGKVKDHGDPKDRLFLGEPRGRAVVVEDVTTTGGSLLEALGDLEETVAEVTGIVCLTDRNQRRDGRTVREAVEDYGYDYYRMSSAEELVSVALDTYSPGGDVVRAVHEEVGL